MKTVPLALALVLASGAAGGPPPQEPEAWAGRVLDYTTGTFPKERADEVWRRAYRLQAHFFEQRPGAVFSFFQNYQLESRRELHLFVEKPDFPAIRAFWSTDDETLDRLYAELREALDEPRTVLLRQIAGPVTEEGEAWAPRPLARWAIRPRFGRIGRALETSRSVVAHVNATYGEEARARAYYEYFGRAGTIWWVIEVDGEEAWERFEARLLADPVYLRILEEAADVFVDESFDDRWMGPL